MIGHPLIEDLSSKTMEQLQETISTLMRRYSSASVMRNQHMVNQLTLILNTYNAEYARRQAELLAKKENK